MYHFTSVYINNKQLISKYKRYFNFSFTTYTQNKGFLNSIRTETENISNTDYSIFLIKERNNYPPGPIYFELIEDVTVIRGWRKDMFVFRYTDSIQFDISKVLCNGGDRHVRNTGFVRSMSYKKKQN